MRQRQGIWSWLAYAVLIAASAAGGLYEAGQSWFIVRGRMATDTSGTAVTSNLATWIPIGVLVACGLLIFFSRRSRRIIAILLALAGLAMIVVGATPKPPSLVEVEFSNARQVSQSLTAAPALFMVAGGVIAVVALVFAWKPGVDRVSSALETDGWIVIERGQDPTLP